MKFETVLFFALLAGVAAEASPAWTVTWSDSSCTTGTVACSQGSYVLRVKRMGNDYSGFGLQIGLGVAGDSVYSVDGLEYLDLRGAISGLDLRADPATNAVWKFSRFGNLCFKPNDGTNLTPAQYITGLHSPGTLVADSSLNIFHIDSGPNPKNTKEIIIDEPNLTTTIGGWHLNSVGGLTNLIYRVPKVQTWSGPTSHSAGGWKTDMGLWDVSGVKYVSSNSKSSSLGTYSGPLGSGASNAKGILRLPSLVNISAGAGANESAAFYNVGIHEVELGLSGNLEYLANYSFKSCNNLTNIVIGASPAGTTLTIWTNAFWCTGIKTVYFNGEKPDIMGQTTCPSFGTTSTPEGQITFYVRDIPSWADVLAEADANGGFVAAATMGTANRQKVARFPGFFKTTVELQDPRFADVYHETVTIERPALVAGQGAWSAGAVTLAATCTVPDDAATDPRRSKFLRWDGVPVELERENPLTYTPTKDAAVMAVFAHDWIMSDDAEPNRTMDNRFWRLCCWKRNVTDHYVGLGKASDQISKGSMWPSDPAQRKGGGDLNLNGDIWDSGGQKWTLASVAGMQVWYIDGKCPTPWSLAASGELALLPTRLTLPETLRWWPGEIQNYDNWEGNGAVWPIQEIIAITPLATGSTSSFTVGACGQISRLVIRAPKLTKIGDGREFGFTWCPSTFSKSNFDEWDLSGVTRVENNGFWGTSDYQIKGTLRLPNVQTIGTNAFSRLIHMTGLELGTNGLTLTSIGDTALRRVPRLANLVIGAKTLTLGTTLGADSVFTGLTALQTVHFPGNVLPQETVDAVLTAIPESATTKAVTIYASPIAHWDTLAAAPTDDEAALKPANCFGVYRAGLRKAWFVTERSPYEPKGTFLIVR